MTSEAFSIKPLFLLILLYFFKNLEISSLRSSRFIYKLKGRFIIYNNLYWIVDYLLNLFSIIRYKPDNVISYEQVSFYLQFQRLVNAFEFELILLKLFKQFLILYHKLVAFFNVWIVLISGIQSCSSKGEKSCKYANEYLGIYIVNFVKLSFGLWVEFHDFVFPQFLLNLPCDFCFLLLIYHWNGTYGIL